MQTLWSVVWRLWLVVVVVGAVVATVVYFKQPTGRCDQAREKILDQSHTSIEEDAVRILSIETIEEVREGLIPTDESLRCVGIVVTNEGLSWLIFNQTRHVGTGTRPHGDIR